MKIEFVGCDMAAIPSREGLLKTLPEGGPMGCYLSTLRGELLRRGVMVGTVELDGHLLTEEFEAEVRDQLTRKFESMRVEVAPTPLFVAQTFRECAGAVGTLRGLGSEITESVRTGRMSEASSELLHFADGLAVLTAAIHDGFQLLERVGLASLGDLEQSQEKIRALETTLREILDGISYQDFVLVSDALAYEFPEHLDGLEREFQTWSRKLQDDRQAQKEQPLVP